MTTELKRGLDSGGPRLLRAADSEYTYFQKSTPATNGLNWLTYGICQLRPGGASGPLLHVGREALLFCMHGPVELELAGKTHILDWYDVAYIPLHATYSLRNRGNEVVELVVCQADAANEHPPYVACWEDIRQDEERIRHLDGKDVFLMFDVSEAADKLIAGYTIYEPHVRAWPPHNHTDQEEVYIFTRGKGAMEVYLDDKTKTFVTSVDTMDAVTLPMLYYHPVFSQDDELHFIWCIAGERYWVGDKNRDFMDATVDQLTT